jgi:hypothetical protein
MPFSGSARRGEICFCFFNAACRAGPGRAPGRDYDLVCFRNGYAKDAPEMLVEFRGIQRSGGDYVIKLGRVLNIKRWRPFKQAKKKTDCVG